MSHLFAVFRVLVDYQLIHSLVHSFIHSKHWNLLVCQFWIDFSYYFATRKHTIWMCMTSESSAVTGCQSAVKVKRFALQASVFMIMIITVIKIIWERKYQFAILCTKTNCFCTGIITGSMTLEAAHIQVANGRASSYVKNSVEKGFLTLIWSWRSAYSMDWKMFQVYLRLISMRAAYCRYQRWISTAAFIAFKRTK